MVRLLVPSAFRRDREGVSVARAELWETLCCVSFTYRGKRPPTQYPEESEEAVT